MILEPILSFQALVQTPEISESFDTLNAGIQTDLGLAKRRRVLKVVFRRAQRSCIDSCLLLFNRYGLFSCG